MNLVISGDPHSSLSEHNTQQIPLHFSREMLQTPSPYTLRSACACLSTPSSSSSSYLHSDTDYASDKTSRINRKTYQTRNREQRRKRKTAVNHNNVKLFCFVFLFGQCMVLIVLWIRWISFERNYPKTLSSECDA